MKDKSLIGKILAFNNGYRKDVGLIYNSNEFYFFMYYLEYGILKIIKVEKKQVFYLSYDMQEKKKELINAVKEKNININIDENDYDGPLPSHKTNNM